MTKPKPKLTIEAFHESLKPPNNCRARAFMDELDMESQAVLTEALKMPAREYPANAIITLLTNAGFESEEIPGIDAWKAHRSGTKPCRCRS